MSGPAISSARSRRRRRICLRGLCHQQIKGMVSINSGTGRRGSGPARLRPWLKDTGATWHSTNDPRVFTTMRKPDKTYVIQYGNKVTEKAAGIGTVHIPLQDSKGERRVLVLRDVLYLPRSSSNIFSSQYFIGQDGNRTGNEYAGRSDGTWIRELDGPWIKLHEESGSAYLVPNGGEPPRGRRPCNLQISEDTSTMAYWHNLLGHASVTRILEMQRLKAVTGMPSKFTDYPEAVQRLKKCDVCLRSKGHRKSNKSRKRTPAKHKFEIVSTDLVQVNVKSEVTQFKWAVVYVDHFTRMKWVYGIRHKSDAHLSLDKFIREEVHARKQTLSTIMSDNGGEFFSSAYLDILAREHVEIRRSAPHTQSQNGIAERAIGSLTAMTRCMLEHARKPTSWWFWAMKTACHNQNRLLTKGLPDGVTPYQMMEDKKPDLSTLHPWGCDMYFLTQRKSRGGNMTNVSRKLAFVGYSRHHSADTYVGYDADKEREYTSFHTCASQHAYTHGSVSDDATGFQWRRHEHDQYAGGALAHDSDDGGATPTAPPAVRVDLTASSSPPPSPTPPPPAGGVGLGGEALSDHDGEVATPTTSPSRGTLPRQRERVEAIDTQPEDAWSEGEGSRVKSTYFETSGSKAAEDRGKREAIAEIADPSISHPRTRSETAAATAAAADTAAAAAAAAAAEADREVVLSQAEARQVFRDFNHMARCHGRSQCCEHFEGALSEHAMRQMHKGRQSKSDLPKDIEEVGLCYAAFNSLDIRIPESRSEARTGKYARHWIAAETEEMDSMQANNVTIEMHERDVPRGANICDSRFVYDIKTDEHGNLDRFKVRWVAKGFSQRRGIDYWETFSPVVRMNTVRMLLALATQEGWDVQQCDVKTAFLEAELEEDIYVRPPPGYGKPTTVYKLRRALYGLKQSSRQWGKKFSQQLRKQGFTPLKSDSCVHVRRRKGGKCTIVAVYVDDCVITGSDTEGIKQTKQELAKAFRLKDLGELRQMLGCTWHRHKDGSSTFTQTKAIVDLANKFSIRLQKEVNTPALLRDQLLKEWQPKEGSDEHKRMIWAPSKRRPRGVNIPVSKMSYQTMYRSIVGNLLWIARCTRPDIMWITSELTRFMQNPGTRHLARAVRVVQYLLATKDIGIRWKRRKPSAKAKHDANELSTCSDASFCDREDGKSSFGYLVYLNGGPVDWQSKGQLNVAMSTCESEYIGMSAAITGTFALAQVLDELGFKQPTVPVYCDNQAAIAISKDDCAHQRTRSIRLRYHHIRDEVSNKNVEIRYCQTDRLVADLMTKSLATKQHVYLRRMACSG